MSEIEVKHLSKTFEQKGVHVDALKDINLTIGAGDIYGIIGMSGAGKSTLVRCLNFLERPTDGQVLIEGKDLGTLNEKELRKQRSDIAMIFQHFNLLMQKNVIDNICFPLQIQGVKKKEARAKARELLKTVGLEEKEKAYPAQLSGGQKQRVAIARALASNPKILLCDEATSALDPQTTASILELLKSINEQFQITIVIITHQMSVIREICNRVAIIEHGELVENGLVEDIFSHPKSKAARELILRDVPENSGKAEGAVAAQMERIQGDKKLRIVFTENSAFEPVIANMILQFGKPVNICFPLQIQGVKKKEARAKARELLKTVGLEEKEKAYPAQLSGGQKQRVAIARALASNPKILLCDEATSALDPQTTASILELLKSINEQFQITIVIITHQMSVIREICNRVAIIEHGELVENGLVEDIFSHPKSKAARELILRDVPENSGKAEGAVAAQMERIQGDKKLRIVFTENSAFEPVIANMILQFGKPVNILRADTKNVGGVAKGEMILGLPDDRHLQIDMEQYLTEHGLEIEEVTGDVE